MERHADLRALLSELQTSGPVGSASSDWYGGHFDREWYRSVGLYCTQLLRVCPKEKFATQLMTFRDTMEKVGNKEEVGTAKAGSNVRTKANVQAVLALWNPLQPTLMTYQTRLLGLEGKTYEDKINLENERGYLKQILDTMKDYCTNYAGGKNVW